MHTSTPIIPLAVTLSRTASALAFADLFRWTSTGMGGPARLLLVPLVLLARSEEADVGKDEPPWWLPMVANSSAAALSTPQQAPWLVARAVAARTDGKETVRWRVWSRCIICEMWRSCVAGC